MTTQMPCIFCCIVFLAGGRHDPFVSERIIDVLLELRKNIIRWAKGLFVWSSSLQVSSLRTLRMHCFTFPPYLTCHTQSWKSPSSTRRYDADNVSRSSASKTRSAAIGYSDIDPGWFSRSPGVTASFSNACNILVTTTASFFSPSLVSL
jgi:hypothetical protein